MLRTAVITDSTATTGFHAYQRREQWRPSTWWDGWRRRLFPPRTIDTAFDRPSVELLSVEPLPVEQLINRGLMAATVSSCAATAGALWFPPLQLISVAGLLYMGAPAAQDAYTAVTVEQRVTPALIETIALTGVLLQGAFLPGALGFTLYYLGRKIVYTIDARQKRLLAWTPPPTARIQRAGVEYEIAVGELQPGDRVIVCTGEMAPIGGMVVEGVAWVDQQPTTTGPDPVVMKAGSSIAPANLVLVGRIGIERQA